MKRKAERQRLQYFVILGLSITSTNRLFTCSGPPASCLYLRGLSLHPGQCSCRPHDTGLGDSDSASNAPSLPAYRHCCGVRVLGVSCQSHTCSSFTLPFCCPVDNTNLDNHNTKYSMYRIWISLNHDHLGHTTGSQPPSEFGYIPVLDWVRRMKPSMHLRHHKRLFKYTIRAPTFSGLATWLWKLPLA